MRYISLKWRDTGRPEAHGVDDSDRARNEEQLRQNLGAVSWNLSAEQTARLSKPVTEFDAGYPRPGDRLLLYPLR
jgi:hypothetical protein